MHTSTAIKFQLNRLLGRLNLQLDSLTLDKIERKRLQALEDRRYFDSAPFTTPQSFDSHNHEVVLAELSRYAERFESFEDPSKNDVGYSYRTVYYTSPDTEVLYVMLRMLQPGTIVEVGSGNSTKIMRQAILDGELKTKLISIDPYPRTEIDGLSDACFRHRVEDVEASYLLTNLKAGDLLFIDSSHVIKTGSDVVYLLLEILPKLPPGVIIHIHDIFLPYDYPKNWVIDERWGFNEQYLVQGMLMFGAAFEVLWAGYYQQRSRADFSKHFPHWKGKEAASLWLKKV
jgi:predicted O-methyltransferase YrrM